MEIIVEIGTDEEKEIIRSELAAIEILSEYLPSYTNINRIIVPSDFDSTINELQGTNSYTSTRRQQAVAKLLEFEEGVTLVFSPLLYTANYDSQVRFLFFFHEVFHAFTRDKFPDVNEESMARFEYLTRLNILFDEYYANRAAFESLYRIIPSDLFSSKSRLLKRHVSRTFKGHINPLIDDSFYYNDISNEIVSFRLGEIDIDTFLENLYPCLDAATKDIIYAYAYIDTHPRLERVQALLMRSKFINANTLALIEFIRLRYANNDFNLNDGLNLIDRFLTNFGIRCEDHSEGLYYHVLDI